MARDIVADVVVIAFVVDVDMHGDFRVSGPVECTHGDGGPVLADGVPE